MGNEEQERIKALEQQMLDLRREVEHINERLSSTIDVAQQAMTIVLDLSSRVNDLYQQISQLATQTVTHVHQILFKIIAIENSISELKHWKDRIVSPFKKTTTDELKLAGISKENITILKEQINQWFSLDEINNLAHQLNIDPENIPGNTKLSKANNLVEYAINKGLFWNLVDESRMQRPGILWPTKI